MREWISDNAALIWVLKDMFSSNQQPRFLANALIEQAHYQFGLGDDQISLVVVLFQ